MIIQVKKGYQLGALPGSIRKGFPAVKGKRVFIKPNLVCPPTKWDIASTTRVEVIQMIIEVLKDEGCQEIVVGDCGFKDQWELTLKLSGYDKLVKRYGVELIGLQEGENFHKFTLVRFPGKTYKSLFGARISDFVLDCDMIIDVPKLKVHSMAFVTGSIKNLMGIMAQKGSMHPKGSHSILHKRLHDLYFLIRDRVSFIIMDGIEGSAYCEQYGIPVQSNLLIYGTDMWQVDSEASLVMGIDPDKVPYLRYIRSSLKASPVRVNKKFIKRYERPLAWRKL